MTLDEFITFDEFKMGIAVWDGAFLTSRVYQKQVVMLYDLGGFYVEVYYTSGKKRIERFRPFKKVDILEPYLRALQIEDFY